MHQALQLRQSKQERSCNTNNFSPLVPPTIRRSMRNTVQALVLNRIADQRETCSINVALPAEAV
jgi:hypothetical protein